MLRINMIDLFKRVIVLIMIVTGQFSCSLGMPTTIPTIMTTMTPIIVDHTTPEQKLTTFFSTMEDLIMNTTDKALNATQDAYNIWMKEISDEVCPIACPLMLAYVEAVDHAVAQNVSYADKRKLFIRFRKTNDQIDLLYDQLSPQAKRINYQLLSEDFYNDGRNTTSFDNLYLNFIQNFEAVSQTLWNSMDETIVEQQQDLLEILDEISTERKLKEKDKLYDEFIELYLFKTDEALKNIEEN